MDITLDRMLPRDWAAVCRIYEAGIATGQATFETRVPAWDHWDAGHVPHCRYVARLPGGKVAGWAALSRVSTRAAYRGVAEISVYVASEYRGLGIGGYFLGSLVHCSEKNGYWTLQASVFPENGASLKILDRAGFRRVGVREGVGQLDGVWRDVVLLERRSPKIR